VKFNSIVSTNLTLIQGNNCQTAKVNISFDLDGITKQVQLLENDRTIQCNYEYDESEIINKAEIDLQSKRITLNKTTGFTVCENLVAMNKSLLQKLYPDEKGKWYFARLEQTEIIENDSLISVKLIKNLNFRLTKSDILLGDEVVIGNQCNIGHGVTVQDKVWLSVGTIVGGNSLIESNSTIGLGVSIKDNLNIGEKTSIGMGAVIIKDTNAKSSYFGNPAKPIRKIKAGPER
jgi:acetyltransferase-like isoleucine patch superfamily enzyme